MRYPATFAGLARRSARVKFAAIVLALAGMTASAWDSPASGTARLPGESGGGRPPVCQHRPAAIHTDPDGVSYTGDGVCGNDYSAPLYLHPSMGEPDSVQTGVMFTTSSWFICWTRGERHKGGGDVWYWTQGDRSVNNPTRKAWGWMPAVFVHTVRDPADSTLPRCATP